MSRYFYYGKIDFLKESDPEVSLISYDTSCIIDDRWGKGEGEKGILTSITLAGAVTNLRRTFTVLRLWQCAFFFYFSSVVCLSFVFSWLYPYCWRHCCSRLCDVGLETVARCTGTFGSIGRIADRDNPPSVYRRSIFRGRSNWSIGRADCCQQYRSIASTCRCPCICPGSRYRDVPRKFGNLRWF